MTTLISRIKEQVDQKQVDTSTAFGRSWLLQKMAKLVPSTKDRLEIIKDREAQRNKTMVGRFYFFYYNPKTKEKLSYWDRFPMAIMLQRYDDGFLGLNLHYIYPKDRLILLSQLEKAATGPLTDERTRLRLSYPILQAMHQAYRATPCIKRYLANHVQSRFIEVPPTEWAIAATLPVQSFASQQTRIHREEAHRAFVEKKKARIAQIRKEEVWKESKEKY